MPFCATTLATSLFDNHDHSLQASGIQCLCNTFSDSSSSRFALRHGEIHRVSDVRHGISFACCFSDSDAPPLKITESVRPPHCPLVGSGCPCNISLSVSAMSPSPLLSCFRTALEHRSASHVLHTHSPMLPRCYRVRHRTLLSVIVLVQKPYYAVCVCVCVCVRSGSSKMPPIDCVRRIEPRLCSNCCGKSVCVIHTINE